MEIAEDLFVINPSEYHVGFLIEAGSVVAETETSQTILNSAMHLQGFYEGRSAFLAWAHAEYALDTFIETGHVFDGNKRKVSHTFAKVDFLEYRIIILLLIGCILWND